MMYQVDDIVIESDGIMRSTTTNHTNTAPHTTNIDNDDTRNDYNQHHHHAELNPYHNKSSAIGNGNTNSSNSSSSVGGICNSLLCCITGSGGSTSTTSSNSNSNSNSTIVTKCTILCLLCNTIVIIVLFVLVLLMGLQLHTLQTQVLQDEMDIATLQTQIMTQMNNQQHLNQRVDEEHSLTLYQMAGTFTLLTCLISVFHMTQHLSNYHEPIIQRKIIAILWMSPIYSITSFLSLIFTNVDPYLAVIKDCYEAYTIYTFLSFLIAVLGRGNRAVAIQVLSCHADQLHQPNRCLSFLYYPSPETSPTAMATAVLTECQILAMQFVLVRPISSILTFVVDVLLQQNNTNDTDVTIEDDSYTSYFKSPNFYIALITNISVFFAFQGLLKFYHAVHLDLKWCQPFNKFLSIKSIVFLTFWQGLLISILINVNNNNHYNNPISNAPTATSLGQPGSVPTVTPINLMYPIPAPTLVDTPISVTPQPLSSRTNNVAVPTTGTTKSSNNNSTRHQRWVRVLEDPNINPSTTDDEHSKSSSSSNNEDPNNTGDDVDNSDTTDNLLNDNSSGNNSNNNQDTNSNSSSNNNNNKNQSNKERASQIQNFLICFEMLLFAIGHWCVFPAEEWKPDYRPPMNYAKPGFGISDFAQDISDIVGNATQHRRRRRRRQEYEPTSNTDSTHPDHPNDDNDEDDAYDRDGVNDFGNGIHPPTDVIDEDYYNDDVMPANSNIHDHHTRVQYDDDDVDVVVDVPFGDVVSTTTVYTDDSRSPSSPHEPHLRTIT